ncbi:MAG: hypothetical protein QOE27_1805 [Solirubrobacteraceae bacterium]|nr:hypothetical protein [Solirubrobacteraceae bacterium]
MTGHVAPATILAMSPTPLTPGPRLLLFPQVARPEGRADRPGVRRYSLSLLSGPRRVERAPRPRAAAPNTPAG